jgi:hypothetical protein
MLSRDRDASGCLMLDHSRGSQGREVGERAAGFLSLTLPGSALSSLPPGRGPASRDHRRYHRFNRARRRLAGRLRIRTRHRRFATAWFDDRLASPEALRRAARGTGWRIAELLSEGAPAYGVVMEKERRA